jgi:hypothetical protein
MERLHAQRNAGEREGRVTMSAIELSAKEAAALVTALKAYLPELTTERVGTDRREWHAELKEQEAILGEILNRLKAVKF